MHSMSKSFGAEVAHKAMGIAPEESELANELYTKPLPPSEAEFNNRRARSGPLGRHARKPVAHASLGPTVRGLGEHATVHNAVLTTATAQHRLPCTTDLVGVYFIHTANTTS